MPTDGEKLSIDEAHRAMFIFVERLWERTGKPAELASLLSDNSLLSDGGTADPAARQDWLDAVEEARRTGPERIAIRFQQE
ncbi:MAG: hypothetical protein M3331_02030 [Actinomycetota bacterium]|nr:hypothetical protein [Actinomycetota bacterium]